MTKTRFTFDRTSSADQRERMWAPAWDQQQSIVTEYLNDFPDSELAQRLKRGPKESQVRTDAVGAVEEVSADGWRVRWVVAEQGEVLIPRSVHLEPDGTGSPEGGITARLLRELSPSRAVAAFDTAGAEAMSDFTKGSIALARDAVAQVGPDPQPGKGPGRPRLTDELLAQVAIVYLSEFSEGSGLLSRVGEHPDVIKAAAESQRSGTVRRGPVPDQTVRDWIFRARKAGFLGPTKAGRKGGGAGPRLMEYLNSRTGVTE